MSTIPAGYKQTEVGVIPEEWLVRDLGAVATLQRGYDLPHRERRPGLVPVITSSGFGETHSEARVTGPGVVTGRYGTIGQVFFVTENFWPLNTTLYVKNFHCNDPWFVAHLLRTIDFHSHSGKSGVPGVNRNDLHQLRVRLPPLPEQLTIAAALSDVDALLAKLDQFIAKKRDLKQAAMQQLLTGQARLPGFSGEWSAIKMAKQASLKARIGWQALTTAEYMDEGNYFLVTGTDFIGGRVNWSSCHYVDQWRYDQDRNIQLRNGDVLLTKDGTIGKVGYVDGLPGPATLNSGIFVIRPPFAALGDSQRAWATLNSGIFVIRPLQESFSPLFLFYILRSKVFDEFLAMITAGSTIVHLYQKDFVTFEFLAPDLKEQTAIATVLSDMDAELAALEARRDKTRALKQGMMQELLTGRIRLV